MHSSIYKESNTYVELLTLSKDPKFSLDSISNESIGFVKDGKHYKTNLTETVNYICIKPHSLIIYTNDDEEPRDITSINIIINGCNVIHAPYSILQNFGKYTKTTDAYILKLNFSMFIDYLPIKIISPIKNIMSISVNDTSNVTNIQLIYSGIKYADENKRKLTIYGDYLSMQTCETNTIARSIPQIFIKQRLSINHISKGLFIESDISKIAEISINVGGYSYIRYTGPIITAICNVYSDYLFYLPFNEGEITTSRASSFSGALLPAKYNNIEIEILFTEPTNLVIIHSLCFNVFSFKSQSFNVIYRCKSDRPHTLLLDDPDATNPTGKFNWN